MPIEERTITKEFDTKSGKVIHVHNLPAIIDTSTNEVIGYRTSISRRISDLVLQAEAQGLEDITFPERFDIAPIESNPISLALQAALQARGMSKADLARIMNVKPPLVSRWLSPHYYEHSEGVLRRIADILGMELEVRLRERPRDVA